MTTLLYFFCVLITVCLLHRVQAEDGGLCLWTYPQYLGQYLKHSRCSMSMCQVNTLNNSTFETLSRSAPTLNMRWVYWRFGISLVDATEGQGNTPVTVMLKWLPMRSQLSNYIINICTEPCSLQRKLVTQENRVEMRKCSSLGWQKAHSEGSEGTGWGRGGGYGQKGPFTAN